MFKKINKKRVLAWMCILACTVIHPDGLKWFGEAKQEEDDKLGPEREGLNTESCQTVCSVIDL